jgi:LPXTG-site transpeptidase (sortase) family protein
VSPTATVVGGIALLVIGAAAGLAAAPVVSTDPESAHLAATTSRSATADDTTPPVPSASEPTAPSRSARPKATGEPGAPVRFHSARLDVAVPVRPIDAAEGVLLPPGDPGQLGWWRGGAMPGSGKGRVLLTGHTVQAGGGAFDDLARIQLGDTVDVRTSTGRHRYQVTLIQYLTIEQFAQHAEELLRSTGPERLVLVTCNGWDGTSYQGSTVVIAEPSRRG